MRWQELSDAPCSLARTLSVVGDRWTLMIVRDCFLGIRRFDEFQADLGITRHVLANRLAKLVEAGVLKKVPYQEKPVREEYRLTQRGHDLYPVILTLLQWGDTHMCEEDGPPVRRIHKSCGNDLHADLICAACGEKVEAQDTRAVAAEGRLAHLPPGIEAS